MIILLISMILLSNQESVTCQVLKRIFTDFQEAKHFITSLFQGIVERLSQTSATTDKNSPEMMEKTYFKSRRIFNSISDGGIIPAMTPSLEKPEPVKYTQLKKHPTALLSTDQLILHYGKNPEIHQVYTADGYGLTLHRIITYSTTGKTVLLHHGLMGSSADWVMLGAQSLPFLLSDAGYDVWMTNARGNYYSQHHKTFKTSTFEFWNFTWQEMGEYDLPAAVNYIRNIKGNQDKIDFIGHSMGASALLVLLSSSRDYNNYIRVGVLLAPLTFMMRSSEELKILFKANLTSNPNIMNETNGEYFPFRKMPSKLSKQCSGHRLYCRNPLLFLTGGLHHSSPLNKNRDFLATLLSHVPAGASLKTIYHYVQIAQSKKFHRYGDVRDEFPLEKVKVPLVIFSSDEDKLSSIADGKKLYLNVANPKEHVILNAQNMTHTEFVWGDQANKLIFSKLLELLKKYTE